MSIVQFFNKHTAMVHDAYFVCDHQSSILYSNIPECDGFPVDGHAHPGLRQRLAAHRLTLSCIGDLEQALAQHQTWDACAATLSTGQEQPQPVLVSITPLAASGGAEAPSIVTFRSAPRQQTEDQLREMLETVQMMAVMWDAAATVTFCNDFLLNQTGWSREEVMGRNWRDQFTPPEEHARFDSAFQLTAPDFRFFPHYEGHLIMKDGQSCLMQWDAILLRDPHGQINGVAAIGRDLTERQKMEEQLRRAQKMEAIGTLAGGIAHDLNNILCPIVGYSDMLRSRTIKKGESPEYIDEILTASQRAKDLVQQILLFSRRREASRQPVQVHRIVQESIRFLRSTLPSSIAINLSLEKERDTVWADPTQIQQVIMNLCTNAYQAISQQDGLIELRLETVNLNTEPMNDPPTLPPGRYVRLRVIDNGQGIDVATQKRIFEPFFTTKPVGEGTGLGLSVVNGIIESCGGAIQFHSQPGQGSTVDCYFPYYQASAQTEEKQADCLPTGKGVILFVDDEPALAKMIKKMIEGLGYEVNVMTDSVAALSEFCNHPAKYDLIFTDQTMPGMNGLELCQKVKTIRPELPVVLYSGSGDSLSAEVAADAGVDMVLNKPLRLGEMSRAIEQVLTRRRR